AGDGEKRDLAAAEIFAAVDLGGALGSDLGEGEAGNGVADFDRHDNLLIRLRRDVATPPRLDQSGLARRALAGIRRGLWMRPLSPSVSSCSPCRALATPVSSDR